MRNISTYDEQRGGVLRVTQDGVSNRQARTALEESLRFHRDRDDGANRLSSPPAGERITWASFWLVDFITPEVLPQTVARLQASPLDQGEGYFASDPPSAWLSEARTSPLSAGYIHLPICMRPSGGWSPATVCDDLPSEVDTVSISVFSLAPGLQVVLASFYLATSGQGMLHDALSRPRRTEAVELSPRSIQYLEPSHQKAEDLKLLRQATHSCAAQWLGNHIPGIFTAEACNWGRVPSCDFVTTRSRVPFPKRPTKRTSAQSFVNDYIRVAGLQGLFETWQSDMLPGFRLGLPDGRYDDPHILTLAARTRDIAGFAERMYPGELLRRTTHKLHHCIDDLLITWGLHELARHYHMQLAEARDRWLERTADPGGTTGRIRDAVALMGKVSDARVIARDLTATTEADHYIQRAPLTFVRVLPQLREYGEELHEALVSTIRREASIVDTLASDLQVATVTGSNLDVAAANLRLQGQVTRLTKWLVWLTVVLVVLTVLLMYKTYYS